VVGLGTARKLKLEDRIKASPLCRQTASRCMQRPRQPLVSSDTPSVWALYAVAAAVRFNALEILATPVFFFANDFNSRTSALVHSRLTDFLANFDSFFFGNRACITDHFVRNAFDFTVWLPLHRSWRTQPINCEVRLSGTQNPLHLPLARP
jgi:hypothetical protein